MKFRVHFTYSGNMVIIITIENTLGGKDLKQQWTHTHTPTPISWFNTLLIPFHTHTTLWFNFHFNTVCNYVNRVSLWKCLGHETAFYVFFFWSEVSIAYIFAYLLDIQMEHRLLVKPYETKNMSIHNLITENGIFRGKFVG